MTPARHDHAEPLAVHQLAAGAYLVMWPAADPVTAAAEDMLVVDAGRASDAWLAIADRVVVHASETLDNDGAHTPSDLPPSS